jgi:hypothetical protein
MRVLAIENGCVRGSGMFTVGVGVVCVCVCVCVGGGVSAFVKHQAAPKFHKYRFVQSQNPRFHNLLNQFLRLYRHIVLFFCKKIRTNIELRSKCDNIKLIILRTITSS